MKKNWLLIFFLLLRGANAQEIAKYRLILLDFKVKQDSRYISLDYLKRELPSALEPEVSKSNLVTTLEREQYSDILEEVEYQFNSRAFFDESTIAKLKKQVGANSALIGQVNERAGELRIDAKIVDIETSKRVGEAYLIDKVSEFNAPSQIADKMRGLACELRNSIKRGDCATSQKNSNDNPKDKKSHSSLPIEQEMHGIIFRVVSCTKIDGKVTCKLEIISKEIDRTIWWCGNSNGWRCGGNFRSPAYDNLGSIYIPTMVSIGNISQEREFQDRLLPAGVVHNASILYEDVSNNATNFSLLTLSIVNGSFSDNKGTFTVQLRNIPFN